MFFFQIRQETGLWIAQCIWLDSFFKLMSKNYISALWWRLVRACCVQSSMAWAAQLRATVNSGCRDILNSLYSNMCKKLTTVVPGRHSGQPHAVSLWLWVCGLKGGNAGSHRQAGRLMHDFQADLCMIFLADLFVIFRLTYAWFFRLTYAWFSDWLMHDFHTALCIIFRLTYAWFF
jgi:hypothetical protein